MGLFKLALIGGAAYYAGKKLNEPKDPNQINQHGGCHGGWGRRRHQQQQQDPSYQQQPTMTRDMQDPTTNNNYPSEKAPLPQEYPTNYGPGYTWGYPPQQQSLPRDVTGDTKAHDEKKGTQMVKYDGPEMVGTMPPAYGGWGRPLSPQQRMYPNGQGVEYADAKRPVVEQQPMWK